MNYPTLYRQFLHHQTPADLADLLRATGSWKRMRIASLDLLGEEKLPFIFATIDLPGSTSGEFVAVMTAIFLEKSRLGSLGTDLRSELFYLPVIAPGPAACRRGSAPSFPRIWRLPMSSCTSRTCSIGSMKSRIIQIRPPAIAWTHAPARTSM